MPSLGDPEHGFFSETTLPSIILIGVAAFEWLINVSKDIYTINIQLTSNYQDIKALRVIGSDPIPMTALHSEPLPTNEAKLFAKVIPEAYQHLFNVFSR